MAAAKLLTDGIWSWYQSPSPSYSAADGAFYFPVITAAGSVYAYKVTPGAVVQSRLLHNVLEIDDHDVGAILRLANGTLLSAYGLHAQTGQFYRLSSAASDVRAWGAEGSISAAALTFANLWQSADTAGTVWNFAQVGSANPRSISYQTSANSGSTWSGFTTLWSPTGSDLPLARYCANGANRIDFLASSGHPFFSAPSLYHFYMTVASNGTPSFFNSAGTSLGSPPFSAATANITRVYDGSTASSMPWDLKIIGGVPTVAFTVYPNAAGAVLTTTTGAQHQYYTGQYNGSWSCSLLAEAGTAWNAAARQDWLYSGQEDYSPGICLDPNDANTVYLSKTYGGTAGVGATDCRLEKWTNASGWSKAADISGATTSLNCRPFAVQGLGPTQILYWNASSYTSYNSYAADVWAYPAVSLPTTKTSTPIWTPGQGPLAAQAYWLISEGSGSATTELASGDSCAFIGSPTWGTGTYGPELSGFSAAIAVNADGPGSALAATANSSAGYPRYLWAFFHGTNTGAAQYIVCFANNTSGAASDLWGLNINNAATGQITGILRDAAGTTAVITATPSASPNNGNPHVLLWYSTSAGNHYLYYDGVQQGTSGVNTPGSYTFQRLTLGAIRRWSTNAQSNPFLGNLIAAGWGLSASLPTASNDITSFAADQYNNLISGQFGGTRGPLAFAAFAAGGLVAGGSSAPSVSYSPPVAGGAVLGGVAAGSPTFAPPASGGPVAGGTVAPSVVFAGASSGGGVVGGAAQGSSPGTFTAIASGGPVAGGVAAPTATFAVTARGGIVAGGSAQPVLLGGAAATTFRQALHAHLLATPAVTAIVGNSVYPGSLPRTHDLERDGPALTYSVFRFSIGFRRHPGHNLSGSDGTIMARVRFDAWSYQYSESDEITAALYQALEGLINATWGTTAIVSCIHSNEVDIATPDPVRRNLIYQITSEYDIRYRIAIPVRP